MASQSADTSLFKGLTSEGLSASLNALSMFAGLSPDVSALGSLLSSDPANSLSSLTDIQASQGTPGAMPLAGLGLPGTLMLGHAGPLVGSEPNPLLQTVLMTNFLAQQQSQAQHFQAANFLSAGTASQPATLAGIDPLITKHHSASELHQKHPSLLKPEHKNSKASRRGPMDDMRQLVRILVKIFPQSICFLQMGEEGGGNRVSEPQIKEYLRRTLGVECPQPEWGLPQGWGEYIAELFSWGLGQPVSQEQAMKCARRQQGRSWEVVEAEIAALGIYTYAWPMPLTLEGVREVQANPPQPPRGSGFSGPWAKAMAEAQAQTQVKRTASHVMGGTSEGGEDVKRSAHKRARVAPSPQSISLLPPIVVAATSTALPVPSLAAPAYPVPVPTLPPAYPTSLTPAKESEVMAKTAHLSIIGCMRDATVGLKAVIELVQAAHLKARHSPTDPLTTSVLPASIKAWQDEVAALQAAWAAASAQLGTAPTPPTYSSAGCGRGTSPPHDVLMSTPQAPHYPSSTFHQPCTTASEARQQDQYAPQPSQSELLLSQPMQSQQTQSQPTQSQPMQSQPMQSQRAVRLKADEYLDSEETEDMEPPSHAAVHAAAGVAGGGQGEGAQPPMPTQSDGTTAGGATIGASVGSLEDGKGSGSQQLRQILYSRLGLEDGGSAAAASLCSESAHHILQQQQQQQQGSESVQALLSDIAKHTEPAQELEHPQGSADALAILYNQINHLMQAQQQQQAGSSAGASLLLDLAAHAQQKEQKEQQAHSDVAPHPPLDNLGACMEQSHGPDQLQDLVAVAAPAASAAEQP